ncbi:LysR family transcriptional regulator [Tropicimonas sp. IMCC34011]|uniref:LysR family transcriptional regulator n=1 Tax=Tropicimonas sp. IMCC34011 TaxID=2248759 RepID=UPI000E22D318|nr:LysR family transcriptional regulator [Tropicimonas sp. IMCC34011]
MDWDDAKFFLAVAREGQMLGAAKRLGTSQARLSRRVSALEEAVGARLLERTTRGSELTEDGQIIFEAAERMEAEMLESLARLQGRRGEVRGTIRIGAPDGFGAAFLAPRLHRLTHIYPDLRIELVPMPHAFSLSRREADIAVMVGRPDRGRLRVQRLADYTLRCYASAGYLARCGTPATPADLEGHDLVGYVEDMIPTSELAYAGEILPGWRSRIEVSTAVGQLAAVRSGAGIGIVHDFMAAGSDLVPVLPGHIVTRTYWMAWHENLRVAQRVRIAAEFIEAEVREARTLFRP